MTGVPKERICGTIEAVAKPNPEFEAFDKAIGQLLSVPRDEMKRRIEAHREASQKNPNKRGPKPKPTTLGIVRPSPDART